VRNVVLCQGMTLAVAGITIGIALSLSRARVLGPPPDR